MSRDASAHEPPGGRLRVLAGGDPGPGGLAALAAAATALLEDERAPAPDPLPAAYRSRWRRAAIEEGIRRGARR